MDLSATDRLAPVRPTQFKPLTSPQTSSIDQGTHSSASRSFFESSHTLHPTQEEGKRDLNLEQRTPIPRLASTYPSASPAQSRYRPIAIAIKPGTQLPKEIKRRSKSGCYTCRKRRIKCGEERPTCRNCFKARKRCLGYDSEQVTRECDRPKTRTTENTVLQKLTAPAAPSTSRKSTIGPRSIAQADSERRLHPRATMDGTAPANMSQSAGEHIPTIDPALTTTDPGTASSNAQMHTTQHPHGMKSFTPQSVREEANKRMDGAGLAPVQVHDLFMIGGIDPPLPRVTNPPPQSVRNEISYIYEHEYAKGIDRFLEVSWYTTYSSYYLFMNPDTVEIFASVLELFATTSDANYEQMRLLPSSESKLVWSLLCLPRTLNAGDQNVNQQPLQTVLARLQILEHLLTANTAAVNPLIQSRPSSADLVQSRQLQFWKLLGHFITVMPQGSASVAPPYMSIEPGTAQAEAENDLSAMRQLLDGIESHDVLYSIAIVRHLAPRVPGFPAALEQSSEMGLIDKVDKQKLLVAKRFLEDEASGKGTSQVVQRLCGMAVRGWRVNGR